MPKKSRRHQKRKIKKKSFEAKGEALCPIMTHWHTAKNYKRNTRKNYAYSLRLIAKKRNNTRNNSLQQRKEILEFVEIILLDKLPEITRPC